jgi:hypothetical protein
MHDTEDVRHDDRGAEENLRRPAGVPDDLWSAVLSVRDMPRVPAMRYREIPVPRSWADFGIGIEMDHREDPLAGPFFTADASEEGTMHRHSAVDRGSSGWIMILYSREPRESWESRWRVAAFAGVPLLNRERNGLTGELYWDYLHEFIGPVREGSVKGTVSVVHDSVFGSGPVQEMYGCEMRVSWTPAGGGETSVNAGAYVAGWADFIESMSGVEEDVSVER